MRLLYNILFNIAFALSAPWYFLKMYRRGSWKNGFGERFGIYDARLKQALTNRQVVWFHAVSVGEVNICTQIVKAIEPHLPLHKIVVSTTTSTGMGLLKERLPSHVTKIYYPIDRRKHVQRAIGLIHPSAVVLVEAEIWPNFLWSLQRRGIPHFLVNARLSERSRRGYKRFGFLFRPLFAGFTGVGAQTEADAALLRDLGCQPDAVHVIGSLKFDAAKIDERRTLNVRGMLAQLGVTEDALILVGGSTHDGEEKILASVCRKLRKKFPNLFPILVPRHHERGAAVGDDLKSLGMRFVYRKEILPKTRFEPGEIECLVVNTTGELRFFYECADVVFIGKSLTAEGGQNPIEPAALGKPVLFGPNMQNFPEIAPAFVKGGGAIQVADADALERALEDLLASKERRVETGAKAAAIVRQNLGSIGRTVDMILEAVKR
jgi:3-deoxy-D-manno-octulosonic-acid transferase